MLRITMLGATAVDNNVPIGPIISSGGSSSGGSSGGSSTSLKCLNGQVALLHPVGGWDAGTCFNVGAKISDPTGTYSVNSDGSVTLVVGPSGCGAGSSQVLPGICAAPGQAFDPGGASCPTGYTKVTEVRLDGSNRSICIPSTPTVDAVVGTLVKACRSAAAGRPFTLDHLGRCVICAAGQGFDANDNCVTLYPAPPVCGKKNPWWDPTTKACVAAQTVNVPGPTQQVYPTCPSTAPWWNPTTKACVAAQTMNIPVPGPTVQISPSCVDPSTPWWDPLTKKCVGKQLQTVNVPGPTVQVPGPTQYVNVPGPTQYVNVPGATQYVNVPGPTQYVDVPGPAVYPTCTNPATPYWNPNVKACVGIPTCPTCPVPTSAPSCPVGQLWDTQQQACVVPPKGVNMWAAALFAGAGVAALVAGLSALARDF